MIQPSPRGELAPVFNLIELGHPVGVILAILVSCWVVDPSLSSGGKLSIISCEWSSWLMIQSTLKFYRENGRQLMVHTFNNQLDPATRSAGSVSLSSAPRSNPCFFNDHFTAETYRWCTTCRQTMASCVTSHTLPFRATTVYLAQERFKWESKKMSRWKNMKNDYLIMMKNVNVHGKPFTT